MTTPTRPYREAKKRWIIKAIRKHQREIARNVKRGHASWNDVHYDFIIRLQAELDARDIASLPVMVKWSDVEPRTPPKGRSGGSDAWEPDGDPDVSDVMWPPPERRPQPGDFTETKW